MYDGLGGGSGRDVYFRAPRLDAGWLTEGAPAVMSVGGCVGQLRNFSFGGFLVELPDTKATFAGPHREEWVELRVRGDLIFSGNALAVRCERSRGGSRLGLKVLENPIEPRELRRRARAATFRESLEAGTAAYSDVSPRYFASASRVSLGLIHWRRLLDRRETEINEDFEGDRKADEIRLLERHAQERFRGEWAAVRAEAIAAASECANDRVAISAAKRITECLITPLLLDAPIWRQAYLKPRGYPGDFELMNFMYDDAPHGQSVFARVMHQLGREERLASTVRDRRRFLRDELALEAKRAVARGRRRVAVLNLGSGPAGEIADFLQRCKDDIELTVTLIDQDEDALEYADRTLRGAAAGSRSGLLDLRCRYLSFRDLFRSQELLQEFAGQDLIYSAGFFDYLPDRVARSLISMLHSLLAVNGRMLVGNAVDAPDVKWVPEFVLDWTMVYRNEHEMIELCSGLELASPPKVLLDRSGAWQFLSLERSE